MVNTSNPPKYSIRELLKKRSLEQKSRLIELYLYSVIADFCNIESALCNAL